MKVTATGVSFMVYFNKQFPRLNFPKRGLYRHKEIEWQFLLLFPADTSLSLIIDSKLPKKALKNVVTFKFCLNFVVTHAPLSTVT